MDERARATLTFGGGIDRATGELATAPGTFRHLLNLIPKEGKAEKRKGLLARATISLSLDGNPATDIPFIAPFRAAAQNVVVANKLGGGVNSLEIHSTSLTGGAPTFRQTWVALAAPLAVVPRVFGAEAFAKFFFAHDEQDVTKRRITSYLSPDFATWVGLQADLDGTGAKNVLFRGVSRYLDYMVGWGFGGDNDKDRPEIVRLSMPGDPTQWRRQHYLLAGPRTEPVLNVLAGPGFAWVLKETETYTILGNDRPSLRIVLADPLFGLAGSHAAVVVDGELYGWSRQGPRVWAGPGASEDLGLPLDLGGPSPEELVASGDADYGWSEFDAVERMVLFGFPNRDLGKTRVYALSLRDRSRPRWGYFEFQRAIMSVGRIYSAQTAPPTATPPTGYPDIAALSFSGLDMGIPWTNTNYIGDETVEVWLKKGAGAYAKVKEVPINAISAQNVTIGTAEGTEPGVLHEVALRYRRGAAFTPGYEGDVTASWSAPAIAQSVASIAGPTACPDPTSVVKVGCDINEVGGKSYISITVEWVDQIPVAVGNIAHVMVGTDPDINLASVVESKPSNGPGIANASGLFGNWLMSSSSPRYVFVRHTLGGVLNSPGVLADGAPFIPSGGCPA